MGITSLRKLLSNLQESNWINCVNIAMLAMQNISSKELFNIKNVFYLFESKQLYIKKYKYIQI